MQPHSPALSALYPRQRPALQLRFHTTNRMVTVNGDYAIGYARRALDDAMAAAFLPFLGPVPPALGSALLQIFPHNSPVAAFHDKPYAYPALSSYFSTSSAQATLCHEARWRLLSDVRRATAAQLSAPLVQLLIRLAHDGAHFPWIDHGDRLAIAAQLHTGIAGHLLPEEDGWPNAFALLADLATQPGPVVISSSHGEIFPNLRASAFTLDENDPEGLAWCRLSEAARFGSCMRYLRERPDRQIHPQAPAAIDEPSIYQIVHPLHRAAKRVGLRIFR